MGQSGAIRFVQGSLNIGESTSPPVIRAVKAAAPEADLVITDAPPGTSCPVIESVRGNDFVVLVTEPTPFGLHDLKLAVAMTRALGLRYGVVINRVGVGDARVHAYCHEVGIQILGEIPDNRRIAEAYSRGEMIMDALPDYAALFIGLFQAVIHEVSNQVRV